MVTSNPQKQSPEVFCIIAVLKNFKKFTRKHLCQSFLFKRPATLFKKGLCHLCFPVNFVKFLRTPFYRTPPWLLLNPSSFNRIRVKEYYLI